MLSLFCPCKYMCIILVQNFHGLSKQSWYQSRFSQRTTSRGVPSPHNCISQSLSRAVIFVSDTGIWSPKGRESRYKIEESKNKLEPRRMDWNSLVLTLSDLDHVQYTAGETGALHLVAKHTPGLGEAEGGSRESGVLAGLAPALCQEA